MRMEKPKASRKHNLLSRQISAGMMTPSDRETTPTRYYRCSDTVDCERKTAWKRMGKPRTNVIPAAGLEKMERGTDFQERIRQKIIPKYTDYVVQGQELELEWSFLVDLPDGEQEAIQLIGHVDGVLYHKQGTRPEALLEIKTTSGYGYKGMVSKGFADFEHYSYGYYIQANRYIHLWNLLFPEQKMTEVCFFIYNLNGDEDPDTYFSGRDYWFSLNTKLFHADLVRLAKLERRIKADETPERGYSKITWRCTGCEFYDACWPKRERIYDDPRRAAKEEALQKARARFTKRVLSR